MSDKNTKRFRKEVRRSVDKNFGVGMEALSHIVRPRPKWIPRWVWTLTYAPLIQKRYMHLIYKHMK